MRRSIEVLCVVAVLAGCNLLPAIDLSAHPVKAEGICEARGGTCGCDGNVKQGEPSPFPQLDCAPTQFCSNVCFGAEPLDAGEPDAGPWDSRVPRLLVGNAEGSLAIWNNVDTVTADVAAAETLAIPMGLRAAAGAPGLFAAGFQNGDVALFDAPRSLSPTAVPRVTVRPADAGVVQLVPAQSDLWILVEGGQAVRLTDFGDPSTARFETATTGAALDDLTYTPKGKSVFASAATSENLQWLEGDIFPLVFHSSSLTLSKGATHQVAMTTTTIFYGDDQSGDLGVQGKLLAAFLSEANRETLVTGLRSVKQITVQRDVAVVAGIDSASGKGAVALYTDAAQVFARLQKPAKPDKYLTHPSLGMPIDVALGADGRLYVLDDGGVCVFRDVKNKPTFVTKVTTGVTHPRTLTLIE